MKKIKLQPSADFKKKYAKLKGPQQKLLQLLSIIYEQVSQTKILKCMTSAGFKNNKGVNYKQAELKPLVAALKKAGLVEAGIQGVICTSAYAEYTTCQAVFDQKFERMALAVESVISAKESWGFGHSYHSYDHAIRDLRIALYRKKSEKTIIQYLEYVQDFAMSTYEDTVDPFELIFTDPINISLLTYLNSDVAQLCFRSILVASVFGMTPVEDVFTLFQQVCKKNATFRDEMESVLLFQYVLRGNFAKVRSIVRQQDSIHSYVYRGFISLITGNPEKSVAQYETALSILADHVAKPQLILQNFVGIFYVVALIALGNPRDMKRAVTYLNRLIKLKHQYVFGAIAMDLKQTVLALQGQKGKARKIAHSCVTGQFNDYLAVLVGHVTLYWQGETLDERGIDLLKHFYVLAEKARYYWISLQVVGILLRSTKKAKYKKEFIRLTAQCPSASELLVDLVTPQEKWQQILSALLSLDPKQTKGGGSVVSQSRLVWLIEFNDEFDDSDLLGDEYDDYEEISIVPRLQKMNKSGKWSKGRAVALKNLHNHQKLNYLSNEDVPICRAIKAKYESSGYYYGRKKVYVFDLEKAVPALINHPHIFSATNPEVQLEFVGREPELHITENKKGYTMSLEPMMDSFVPYVLIRETLTRVGVVLMTPGFKKVAEIIDSAIDVPTQAKDMVVQVISTIAPHLAVHTDIVGVAPDVEQVAADSTPYFHLVPFGDGLRAESLIKPFKESGSFQHPGKGGKVVLTEVDGKKLQAERNLKVEEKKAETIISKCPVLSRLDEGTGEWLIDEPEDCLELINQLQELQDEVMIQWPQGESLRLSATVSSSAFNVQIKKDNDWFGVTGSLQVDAKTVIDMGKLLTLSRQTESRFIKMDDGQFLALTKTLKRRIQELDSFSEDTKDGVRFSPLASLALEDFVDEIGTVKGDSHWRKNLKRFANVAPPQIPSTFQAELRDYQVAGVNWLATLSGWNVGACLADDMGLGKTVQALAAILLRAADGPTLVVAPTSVLMNWTDEASRFAPTLNVLSFGVGNRQKMLKQLQPFDMVVSSYGLLQSEGKKLAEVQWQTIVLDEAQAIKNMATKRSKSAMVLQAKFRIITTGTPIENHLGELWNLFQFINPGLLGSSDSFNKKYATPIEKYKDKQARGRLKKLIQPFILRRLKRDVLQELPPRTEMTLQVEMSGEEAAMYEAQRNQALEKIAEAEGAGSGQHMQILAEITRLRRFCCNPELVVPGCGLSSSKLKVFGDTVKELLDNGHKALVFSQFVGHLAILRDYLDTQRVSYQYLDGSTPVKKRKKRINAFQAGKGDIFLISLKAGGSGLNLTAADYVIHMDPWWNPAVEDQASDRAHRIGQKRPVTVYRLVVKGSIEEKILDLHAHKRDLADNLLEGADMSGKVSTKQLLELMRG